MDIAALDSYLNDVPRCASDEWHVGPFVVYIGVPGFSFYARPLSDLGTRPPTDNEVADLLHFMQDRHVPVSLEWISEAVHPEFEKSLARFGLQTHSYPLLLLKTFSPAPAPSGYTVRILPPDADELNAARSTLDLAFANPESRTIGITERDLHLQTDDPGIGLRRSLMADGLTVMAVAEKQSGPISAGSHNPRGTISELVGIATLPAYRGKGLARAVTSELVRDALARGVHTNFLTAEDDRVASIYESLGFQRCGTNMSASLLTDPYS